jgi:opacity protein-like surface antigen
MKRTVLAVAALLVLGTASAQNQTPWYGELGYSWMKIDAGGTSGRPAALRGVIGYNMHPLFALEGMLAGGLTDDDKSVTVGGTQQNANFELKQMYGLFIKPKYVTGGLELFGRLGYAHTKVRVFSSTLNANTTQSDDDVSYGLGVNYNFNPRMYVGLDWMRYSDQSGHKVDGMTLGFGYRF